MRSPVHRTGEEIAGRQRELRILGTALAETRTGSGRLVLLSGEPGIGKTRLAQEVAGHALAAGHAVAWGRCVEAEGAPAYWPWHQVLRSLHVPGDAIDTAAAESPEERFRLYDTVTDALFHLAAERGLVVVLDDIHWADEPSLLLLRHLAARLADVPLLTVATLRDGEPATTLRRLLPDLVRSPVAERLELRGLDADAVRRQLTGLVDAETADSRAEQVRDVTGGNPFFVRELARALADGTWRDDRPPRTVLDVVAARIDRVSSDCRRLVQAAAVIGRDFSLPLVAAVRDTAPAGCLPAVDEAIAHGLVEEVGERGGHRFVHALTRDAVEASLDTAARLALHRTVALAIERTCGPDLTEHLTDLARHWAHLAPYGEAATARVWAARAGDEAVRRLAYEEGVRLFRAALSYGGDALRAVERCRLHLSLASAAYFAGDLVTWIDAASAAAATARAAGDVVLLAESALVLEAAPDPAVSAAAKELCDQALAALGDGAEHLALRARLNALRSHLAFYEGDPALTEALSRTALGLAHSAGDDRALVDALRARQEALPGPAGRAERLGLAADMVAAASRLGSPRSEMWGRLWRVEALAETGAFAAAAAELPGLAGTVARVGGPVSAWHLDRVTACVAQAQGRYADAATASRRGFERMRVIEAAPANGAYFAVQAALARHLGPTDEVVTMAREVFASPPRFLSMGRLSRAYVLLLAGLTDESAASYLQAGRAGQWALPVFFVLPGLVFGTLVAAGLARCDDVTTLLDLLTPYRGEHVVGGGVSYMGPVELALGHGAAALGRYDDAVADLTTAVQRAEDAGAPGFAAEGRFHRAVALRHRNSRGDREAALRSARESDRLARALGMTAYVDRTGALVAELSAESAPASRLSAREVEVAALVGEGLTNRQIADRLFISERTAQNHVQHVLTKLGFTTRSQIAAWTAAAQRGNE